MNRLERITQRRATKSWRVKAERRRYRRRFLFHHRCVSACRVGHSAHCAGLLPMLMLVGMAILSGLLSTRGMQKATNASIWLTMALGFGGAYWASCL